MYRPSKRQPRGAWARHLHEQRRLRNLSQVQAFEIVYQRMGWSAKSRTAYVSIDMGDRQPRGDEVTILGAEFGWPPDPLDIEPTEDPTMATALIAHAKALEAQALAFNRLAESIDQMGQRVTRRVEDGVTAFEDVVTLLRSQRTTAGDVSPPANDHAR